jgi:hypothetical protein
MIRGMISAKNETCHKLEIQKYQYFLKNKSYAYKTEPLC